MNHEHRPLTATEIQQRIDEANRSENMQRARHALERFLDPLIDRAWKLVNEKLNRPED